MKKRFAIIGLLGCLTIGAIAMQQLDTTAGSEVTAPTDNPKKNKYKEVSHPTPNYDRNKRNTVEGVILHHTAAPTVER